MQCVSKKVYTKNHSQMSYRFTLKLIPKFISKSFMMKAKLSVLFIYWTNIGFMLMVKRLNVTNVTKLSNHFLHWTNIFPRFILIVENLNATNVTKLSNHFLYWINILPRFMLMVKRLNVTNSAVETFDFNKVKIETYM